MKHVLRALLPTAALVAASPAVLVAQEEGQPGLFDINAGLIIWTWVVFLLLFFALARFAWRPIIAAIDAREQRIQGALDESEAQRAEAARLLEEHKAQLVDARRQASEIIAQGKAAGEDVRRDIEEKARTEAGEILERARSEIEREKDRALAELRKESVELALAAAAKLMHERLDDSRDRELVMGYLDDLEGPSEGASA